MKSRLLAGLAATSLTLSACGIGALPVPAPNGLGMGLFNAAPSPPGKAKWTILVHLAADNNLYDFGLEDLNEMEAGLNGKDVNLIVLFDGEKPGDSAIYRIKRDPGGLNTKIISEKVNDGGAIIPASKEIDSGNAALNGKFAAWAVKKFPAERYGIFFWDHGSGIFRGNRSLINKGFGWDDNGTNMETRDIKPILGGAVQVMGQPFEIYGFDACLMAHVELAYQARGVANVMVASEELEPGAGWDYRAWVKALSANPGLNGAGLGKAMVDTYVKSYLPGGSQNNGGTAQDATLSATNIQALTGAFVPALNRFSASLAAAYPENKEALDGLRKQTATFDNTDCADLGHFLKLFHQSKLPAELKMEASAVEVARTQAVVANGTCGGANMANGSGLVIYFPRSDQKVNPVYSDPKQIAFGAEGWKDYLIKSHGQRGF